MFQEIKKCTLGDTPLKNNKWIDMSEEIPMDSPCTVRLHGDGEWDAVTTHNYEKFRIFAMRIDGDIKNCSVYMGG